MLSYPDGRTIKVGDHIWWNEGTCVGYVEDVIETDHQIDSWGLSEASIAVSNIHPYDVICQKHPQETGAALLGGTVVYSLTDLADEGIGLLSASDEFEFSAALRLAFARLPEPDRGCPYCVTAYFDGASNVEHWHFHFLDQSGRVLHGISIPLHLARDQHDKATQ